MRDAVSRKLFEGLKAFADHPSRSEEADRPERSIRQLVGSFDNARYLETAGRGEVRARFKPVDGKGYEWVRSLIESARDGPSDRPLIGISIDGWGSTDGTKEIAGRTYNMVREIANLPSADLVTQADAGGQFHRKLSKSLRGATAVASEPEVIGRSGEAAEACRQGAGAARAGAAARGRGRGRQTALQAA